MGVGQWTLKSYRWRLWTISVGSACNPQTSRSTRRLVFALFHSERGHSRGGVHLSEGRLHVDREFRHDRADRVSHQFLGPVPHGVLFFFASNLRLRFFLTVVDADGLLLRVDGHELGALSFNPVLEFRFRSRHGSVLPRR